MIGREFRIFKLNIPPSYGVPDGPIIIAFHLVISLLLIGAAEIPDVVDSNSFIFKYNLTMLIF